MEYFTIKRFLFLVPSNDCNEELEKIDKFINLLNKSKIGKIIEKEQKEKGRSGYNPYNLFAAIIYCFSKFKSSLREIENLCMFDIRVIYLMGQEQPSHNVIKDCINRYIVPYQYEIFTSITKAMIDELNVDVTTDNVNIKM